MFYSSRPWGGFIVETMKRDKDRPEYDWIHGECVKYSDWIYPAEELRDEDGEVVPGCYRTVPIDSEDI